MYNLDEADRYCGGKEAASRKRRPPMENVPVSLPIREENRGRESADKLTVEIAGKTRLW